PDNFRITHGPYLCDMSETGVTIVWMTNRKAMSWVEIAPDDGTNFYGYERPKIHDTKYGRIQANTTLHHVRINNLKPGTTYRYAVFSKELVDWPTDSKITYGTTIANQAYARNPLSFRTFSAEDDSVTFIVFNDLHGRAQFMKDMCKNVDFRKIDFVIFNGDMSSAVNSEEQLFTDFIDPSVELFASRVPVMFTRGNHETRGTFADNLMNYFPKQNETIYEMVKVGNVAMLMLDCGEDKPDSDIEYSGLADFDAYREQEAAWLKETVKTEAFRSASARIAILHMPPLVSNWHGNIHLGETLLPVLNDANVTAMLSGHTHRYSYNKPVPGKINFPVLVNSNNALIKCEVVKGKMKATIIGPDAKPLEHDLN
ncbi:MAG TPA: FN3 domain-containing metallophosphoesterase family protein, partial [Bacteroidales bacterium]|nr:FN3 domain-containing metallophosphoesterase family protein [Bacteroidales bacterium]